MKEVINHFDGVINHLDEVFDHFVRVINHLDKVIVILGPLTRRMKEVPADSYADALCFCSTERLVELPYQ